MTSSSLTVNNAIVPIPNTQKDFYNWEERRALKVAQAASRSHDLIFVGDSITHMFEASERGLPVWEQHYGAYSTLNLGYGWDCTQNVLWRLQNGEFAGQQPRLLVLNIGTNNLTGNSGGRANSAMEIVQGIAAIVELVHDASPDTVVLQMGLLPRGKSDDAIFGKVKEVNTLLREWVEASPGILFSDIGAQFLQPDGEIPLDLMNDRVHPTTAGYRIWAATIDPIVRKCLGR
ncbi:MAG: GDSL-type esterase/lipase family protein [Candidatus Methylacidiphilales bacterium]|nr:GDSL-type esterase/lipase family protein [Candidatus Methylacidiphilales bacterium]